MFSLSSPSCLVFRGFHPFRAIPSMRYHEYSISGSVHESPRPKQDGKRHVFCSMSFWATGQVAVCEQVGAELQWIEMAKLSGERLWLSSSFLSSSPSKTPPVTIVHPPVGSEEAHVEWHQLGHRTQRKQAQSRVRLIHRMPSLPVARMPGERAKTSPNACEGEEANTWLSECQSH